MTESKISEDRRLASELKELNKKLTLDPGFSRECYSALTRVQWRLSKTPSVSCDFTYRDAASAIASVRNEHRGLNEQILEKEAAEKIGITFEDRKGVTDVESREAGVDVIYKDELLSGRDSVCVCKCNHAKASHGSDGLCRVKKKSVVNGEEKTVACHCSIYLGPEDYRDVIYCAPQGVVSKRVRKAFAQLGWEPAPPGSAVGTLRGVLSYGDGLDAIRKFTEKEYSVENIAFLEAIHQFKQWIPKPSEVQKKYEEAKGIVKKFIEESAEQQVNLPSWTSRKVTEEINQIGDNLSSLPKSPTKRNYLVPNLEAPNAIKIMNKKYREEKKEEVWTLVRLTPSPQPIEDRLYHVFDEAEDEIFFLVQKDTFPRFTKADLYQPLVKTSDVQTKHGCVIL